MQGMRSDGRLGYVLVSVEADLTKRGEVLVRINDHYEGPRNGEQEGHSGAKWATEILAENFNSSYKRAETIQRNLLNNFLSATQVDDGN